LKNILVLGDSFSYGQGCLDRLEHSTFIHPPSMYSWPSLLAADLIKTDYRIINKSRPGNSIMGMFDVLFHYKEPIDMIIFAVTSFERLLVADQKNPDNFKNWVIGVDTPHDPTMITYNTSKEMYRKYLVNDKIMHLHKIAYMSAVFNYATKQKIKCLYSVPKIYKYDYSLIESDGIAFEHMCDWDAPTMYRANKNTYTVPDGHPNELGHLIYYEHVIKPKILPYIKENI
jgi:hypothetical protein